MRREPYKQTHRHKKTDIQADRQTSNDREGSAYEKNLNKIRQISHYMKGKNDGKSG